MTPCDKCGRQSVVFIRYSGAHLCAQHFSEFVERRVKHEIREQLDLKGGERLAVAVSGGKDSTVALELVHRILGGRKGLAMCAVTVDEGIAGYRGSSIPIVSRACSRLGLEHKVVSFKDLYGTTMDEISKKAREQSACSYCGVLRRRAMNSAARDWGATHLATGLNLDDTAQSILMNFARGDVERLARLGPHRHIQPGLVPRIQPLRTIPESESLLYAIVNGLEFHDLECPYAPEAVRNEFRAVIARLEDQFPGTRHSMLRSYDEIRPALERRFEPAALGACQCGEPTASGRCKACELLESLKGAPR
ncbi:MAG: hypothetical protein QG582_10 [Candidatus Thermoplasmatota archaeon]|nr:hypothetical protein [Candidatus Thermoplasmatota archaeon]